MVVSWWIVGVLLASVLLVPIITPGKYRLRLRNLNSVTILNFFLRLRAKG